MQWWCQKLNDLSESNSRKINNSVSNSILDADWAFLDATGELVFIEDHPGPVYYGSNNADSPGVCAASNDQAYIIDQFGIKRMVKMYQL